MGKWDDNKITELKAELTECERSRVAFRDLADSMICETEEQAAHIERLMVLAHAIIQGEDIPWLLDKATMLVNVTSTQSLAKHDVEVIRKMLKYFRDNRLVTHRNFIEKYADQLEKDIKEDE